MTIEEFAEVTTHRIPTPGEFVAFAEGQRWQFLVSPTSAALKVPDRTDPLALAFAKMLSREPYRTNVLKLLADRRASGTLAPEAEKVPPADAPTILPLPACAKCKRPVDIKRRCWHCQDRPCVGCGKSTGSVLVATCFTCGALEGRA